MSRRSSVVLFTILISRSARLLVRAPEISHEPEYLIPILPTSENEIFSPCSFLSTTFSLLNGRGCGSPSPHYRVSDQIASGNLPFHPLQVKLLTLEPLLPQHRYRGEILDMLSCRSSSATRFSRVWMIVTIASGSVCISARISSRSNVIPQYLFISHNIKI